MADSLTRADIVDGLRDLVAELHASGEVAGIRLVGGAALALRYFERRTTSDLDALHVNPGTNEAVLSAAATVAARRGWADGWVNFAVERADSIPVFGRRPVEWETVYDHDGVVIEVAAKEALLAMKLRANRPGRDTDDIRQLLALCGVATLDEAESLYADFYPGDGLTDRAVDMVARILSVGLPAEVAAPRPIEL
ncbi:hypothetical protein [Microbacterium hydrocarbonoxydans]|uniref:hypothetical protein n=1 Tax=Microbacterium hydrocarbonoxydans TaxID=273678 RepID=UPI0020409100|nr:hypothetical protein [Microbacterium hydrocarbonoxydans]MCM3780527.1 hypothetical protein [Microbacterium hydrocarbonoxydans]